MSDTMRRVTPFAIEPQPDPASSFRDRIAARCAEHDATYPRAVDLEARLLTGVHGALHGVATHLRGHHSARRFREQLMGERHFPVADLCRLVVDPTREAKLAAHAAVTELAHALGFRLERLDPKDVEAHEALASVMESAGAFGAEWSRALKNDGRLDAIEAEALTPELDALEAGVARARALAVKARGNRGC